MSDISTSLLGLLLMVLLGYSCQTTQALTRATAFEASTIPTIDGQLQDWNTPMVQAKDYNVFQYNLGYDADNLYLAVRVTDRGIQQRIMLYGMTVFMDTTGKRKEDLGLAYPLPFSEDQMNKAAFEASAGGTLDRNAFNRIYARMSQEFELLGFVEDDPKERIRVSNLASKGLKTAMGYDQVDALLIEYKIPFQQLYDRALNFDEIISFHIQVNAPAANADEEPGLFDDPNNPILTGTRQNNPMLQGNQMGMQQQRMRRNSNAPLGTWATIQLLPLTEE